jgi:hypothetical protein
MPRAALGKQFIEVPLTAIREPLQNVISLEFNSNERPDELLAMNDINLVNGGMIVAGGAVAAGDTWIRA